MHKGIGHTAAVRPANLVSCYLTEHKISASIDVAYVVRVRVRVRVRNKSSVIPPLNHWWGAGCRNITQEGYILGSSDVDTLRDNWGSDAIKNCRMRMR